MVVALTTVAWWFGQFPYIVRRTPHSELRPTCEFRLCHAFTASRRRPASTFTSARRPYFLLLLTLHKLFIMQHFIIIVITIISGLHYFLCTGKWSGLGSIVNSVYWHTPRRGLWRHSAGLHWPCYVTTSECRALRSATSEPTWGLGPCPAVSSDRASTPSTLTS